MPRYLLLIILPILILTSACDPEGPVKSPLNESADGSTVNLGVGEPVVIELGGNPTTGYQWMEPKNGQNKLDVVIDYEGHRNPGGATGVGGVFRIYVTPLEVGRAELILEYRRSWEDKSPAEVFTLFLNSSQ